MGRGSLENKVILITGAAQGLGLAMARGCAQCGATVAMADINGGRLSESVRRLREEGLRCEGYPMDITKWDDIAAGIRGMVEKHGRIDGLVNNAGITSKVRFLDSTVRDFDHVVDLNLRSVYMCCRVAAEYMVRQKGGSIVNIASVAARSGGGLMSTSLYAASKGAVISLTKGLARELAEHHIRVNAIAPGSIDTPMTTKDRDDREYEESVKKIPLHRRGRPEELVGPAILLLSEAGAFMVGTTLDVNGGSYLY